MRAARSRPKVAVPARASVQRTIEDTRSEIRKVHWPSKDETVRLTIVVIALSIVLSIFLGVIVDGIFSYLYRWLIGL